MPGHTNSKINRSCYKIITSSTVPDILYYLKFFDTTTTITDSYYILNLIMVNDDFDYGTLSLYVTFLFYIQAL